MVAGYCMLVQDFALAASLKANFLTGGTSDIMSQPWHAES